MRLIAVLVSLVLPTIVLAQDNGFRLALPKVLQDNGFAQYLLPRFSLKHGIRITRLGPDDPAEARFGSTGTPVFVGLGQVWALEHDGSPGPTRFAEWLRSDIGRNTISGFQIDGQAPFTPEIAAPVASVALTFDGDPELGERLSFRLCGRCHVINDTNRMKGMEATPSFGMLRTLDNWQQRFSAFYTLNPHPSFTQIVGITADFDPSRPPPIVPLQLTQDDLEDLLAFVATIAPADLGAPIQFQ